MMLLPLSRYLDLFCFRNRYMTIDFKYSFDTHF